MALRLIADENIEDSLVAGVCQRLPHLYFIRVQDMCIRGTPNPIILDWAATAGRLVVSHDVNTMIGFAYERIAAGLFTPDVVILPNTLSIGATIRELVIFVECSYDNEW